MSFITHSDHPRGQSRFGIYVAFLPWILFSVITEHSTLRIASIAALTAAILISLPSLLNGRPKLLELGAVLAFAGFATVAFSVDPVTSESVARYARAIAAGGLALIAFGSLLFTPFTEQYARESVPRQFWTTPQFKALNHQLTTMWAWVFVAMIPCHLVAGAIDTHRTNLIFNWAIPVVLIMWAAKRTEAAIPTVAAR